MKKAVPLLIFCVAALLGIGLVMLYSAGISNELKAARYFPTQAKALGIGLVACSVAALIDYHFWQRTWWIWFAIAFVGLALCFLPPLRHKINGSWRWLAFHNITCQPSEFAKIAAVFFLAYWF